MLARILLELEKANYGRQPDNQKEINFPQPDSGRMLHTTNFNGRKRVTDARHLY